MFKILRLNEMLSVDGKGELVVILGNFNRRKWRWRGNISKVDWERVFSEVVGKLRDCGVLNIKWEKWIKEGGDVLNGRVSKVRIENWLLNLEVWRILEDIGGGGLG